jgi:hypothetical protein
MNKRLLFWLGIFILVLLIIVGVLSAVAAANNVALSRATDQNVGARTANQLKPLGCAGLNLTSVFNCTQNNCRPTGSNMLVLGNNNTRRINGNRITGVSCCVGNPGTTYTNCTWHP